MQNLIIDKNVLKDIKMSPKELIVDIAVYLYKIEKLSFGKAKKLANLNHLEFQKELAKRKVSIHYSLDDLQDDLNTLDQL